MSDLNFKNICSNAINIFEKIELLKNRLNEIKLAKEQQTVFDSERKLEIANICTELKNKYETITNKKCLNKIRKKLNKKCKFKKSTKRIFYKNELESLLKNKEVNQNESIKLNEKNQQNENESQNNNKVMKKLNNQIMELKDLRDHLSVIIKILKVRTQQKKLASNAANDKLNLLISQVDERRKSYEFERQLIKDEIKSCNLNISKYQQLKMKDNLNRIENQIRENLFGSSNSSSLNVNDLFHNQAENSIEQLISIRQEWDNFISTSSNSESVPIEWVYLNEDHKSDNEWSQFIKHI